MKVIVTNGQETHEALLEIVCGATTRFTIVIVTEVWTINFNRADLRSVSSSLPDNRKVYLKIG